MRRNSWKSIALLTEYGMQALRNAMFYDIFSVVSAAIANGAENYLAASGTLPTQAEMDAMALYLMEHEDGEKTILGMTKYIQAASKLNGFVSEDMINEVHNNGILGTYDGCSLVPINSTKKVYLGTDTTTLIPDDVMLGIAGKIGALDMKGDVHVYQDEDNNKEKIHIMIKDFSYGYSFNEDTLDKVFKLKF